MEFTLGSLAQKPDHSLIYKNGYQLKTVVESTVMPLSTQIIKTNIFIKHSADYHLQLFMNDVFNNKLKIDGELGNYIKATNRLFEFTVTNLTNEEIFIRKNMYIVDVVAVHDVINNLTKLVPEVVTPYVSQLQLNDNNKPESDHIMEMIAKEKENNTKLSLQLAADEAERLKNIQLTEVAKQMELTKQAEPVLELKQTELVKQVQESELNLSKPIDIVVKSVEPVVKPKRKVVKKVV
jgi:hypothetical protein